MFSEVIYSYVECLASVLLIVMLFGLNLWTSECS